MNVEQQPDFERRCRELYAGSVDSLDMRIRSRLTQARHAALAQAQDGGARSTWMKWTPVYGAAAALVLGVALWQGHAPSDRFAAMADSRNGIEDLELVASNEQIEFLQDDPEFYDWIAADAGNGAAPALPAPETAG